jgi:hypothetical protein
LDVMANPLGGAIALAFPSSYNHINRLKWLVKADNLRSRLGSAA